MLMIMDLTNHPFGVLLPMGTSIAVRSLYISNQLNIFSVSVKRIL